MQVIVINLASAVERRKFQEQQLGNLGLDFLFLCATSADDIDDKIYRRHYYDWQRPLRRSEVACYFSHKRCWEKVLKNNEPALVIEDDALFSHNLPNILSILKNRKDIDLVDLEVTGRKKNVSRTSEYLNRSSQLFRLYLNSSGAGGYILYPSGAKKLLEKEKKEGISLADAHIATCHTLVSYQVEPAVVVQFILCQHYDITHSSILDFCSSSTNSEKKGDIDLKFKVKRAISEIKLGIRKLLLLFWSKRRYILLSKEDFTRL